VAEPLRALLAGGGTAGHVNPLLALAAELRRRDPATEITVLGTAEGLESRLVPEQGYPLALVPRVPLPRRPSVEGLRMPGRLVEAVRAAGRAIDEARADVVVGFGGYVATPAYLAARRRGIPIVVHEQNARPGLANRLGARNAAAVALTFPGTRLRASSGPAVVTGLPLRPAIAALVRDRASDPAAARYRGATELGLDPGRTTVLVTGGSLGAVSLNSTMGRAASALVGAGAQVLHLTGNGKADAVLADIAAAGPAVATDYHVREYLERIDQAYAACDVVVARSGAGTVCELAALGLPAVYVPLPIGNGEQRLNAADVVDGGGGILVTDADFTPEWVGTYLVPLVADRDRIATMARAASAHGVRDGAARLADLVERAAGRGAR
jgi:UDP-N-acetylglucosamine--N-acetylmuramyl-(pentapeptide) pyrophosphoryl-undecaprenol N-acetylglucosamine transferase